MDHFGWVKFSDNFKEVVKATSNNPARNNNNQAIYKFYLTKVGALSYKTFSIG